MFKLDLEKAEEPEIKLPTSVRSLKKQESSRKNIYFCFVDYAKAFDCVDHTVENSVENSSRIFSEKNFQENSVKNCGKFFKR